ncbi:MAG TPA: YcxB family protein [Usitatibacter sp.]|nr:YcxB family protein [Usitatibacter sp.]
MPTITIFVSYGLGEYLSVVRDHLPTMLEMGVATGKLKRMPPKVWHPLFLAGSIVAFVFKKRRVGDCTFVIDEKGIHRSALDGAMTVPWSDLVAVRRYSRAYLIDEGSKGAMALPYRCFSPEQKVAMEGFIRAFEVDRPLSEEP